MTTKQKEDLIQFIKCHYNKQLVNKDGTEPKYIHVPASCIISYIHKI